MEFIAATQKHYAEIIDLVSSPEDLFYIYPQAQFPLDIEQLEYLFRHRHNMTVGLIDGVVVAFASLYDVVQGDQAFIGNVIVAENYQGQGIGTALTHHMIRACIFEHNAVPHISVFGANSGALLLYTRMDFKPYEVEARKGLDGTEVALIKMSYEPSV